MQKTIKFTSEVSGTAVNGKSQAKVVFVGAEPDTGIVFIRDDLPDKPEIKCCPNNAVINHRWSSLVKDGIRVEHTEHILAAISGLGITNIRIHLNGPYLPIVSEFSSLEFVEAIQKAEPVTQAVPQKYREVKEPLWILDEFELRNGNRYDSFLFALPSDHFSITYFLHYPEKKIPTQIAHFSTMDSDNFLSEFAGARSFILDEEYDSMVPYFGINLKNCLSIPSGSASLRWNNEIARHKVLDLIGDLMLTGQPIKGQFFGFRSGHKMNIKMAQLLNNRC